MIVVDIKSEINLRVIFNIDIEVLVLHLIFLHVPEEI